MRPEIRLILNFLYLLILLNLLALSARADELRLKDGTKIIGTIVGFEDNSFKVQTAYGFALVRRDAVASIILSDPAKELPKAAQPAPAPAPAKVETPAPPPQPPPPVNVREEVEGNAYTNHTYSFRMYKPPSWRLIEGARKMLPNAVVAMGTSDETTLFVVAREPLVGTLENYAAATARRLRGTYEHFRALDEKKVTIAGAAAIQQRFRGTVDEHDWSGVISFLVRGSEVFTIVGMTYSDSELIQIQENVIARAISSLEFLSP
jgi:hypothetical protein